MANVLLTQLCVRSCPYCFAQKYMGEVSPKDMLSWDNLIYLADFFIKSGVYHMSLLGGEPLLHPQFSEFVHYLSKRGIHSSREAPCPALPLDGTHSKDSLGGSMVLHNRQLQNPQRPKLKTCAFWHQCSTFYIQPRLLPFLPSCANITSSL